ncbi:PEP/pyruvate-binding domain-containing protein [Candidatus Sumerlaeota bacterium]|nr:PEP/pyruvate-binding domain-containing protein [Candidatus Sumerlaeota bacterium]
MDGVEISTGLPGLDRVLRRILAGDNIVWHTNSIEDYKLFVQPYADWVRDQGSEIIYFRFAQHEPLLEAGPGVEVIPLSSKEGLEHFLITMHRHIEMGGRGAYYVFDCLTDLAIDWYSDTMLGNFFQLTCPYLYDIEAVAYFCLLRNQHSFYATTPITDTAQVVIDVHNHRDKIYIHPLKVQQRHSPTMYMLHVWDGDEFAPATESVIISEIMASVGRPELASASTTRDVWQRSFTRLQQLWEDKKRGLASKDEIEQCKERVLRMAVSRDDRLLQLARKYFTVEDLLDISHRTIGTGMLGGKAVGMLLARAILKKEDPRWQDLLEVQDSFYIASDVFYTFLVRNGCWWIRQQQYDHEKYLEGAERGRHRILQGEFPDYIVQQFSDLLDYYGQSPIIVRSSSLLEDAFGNAFAGKYISVFCPNQGSRKQRLDDFIAAVRQVYASTMSERALSYRARRNVLHQDEQMSLLVMRVSGALYGNYFFPQIAGVGFSFNPYVWHEDIDPNAGMLRLVYGLGTRAVDRTDDDYTRLVALNAPMRRPESNIEEITQFAQHKVDVLDLEVNQLLSYRFENVAAKPGLKPPLSIFASRDEQLLRESRDRGGEVFSWFLTFDNLLSETEFVQDMRQMMRLLHDAYDYPVDVEFTANFLDEKSYRINLVQCRPLQVIGVGEAPETPVNLSREETILEAHGAVIGHSRQIPIHRFIYVVPSIYSRMPQTERYSVARLIGRITQAPLDDKDGKIFLIGPGRWGTTTPSLGVPVSFAEINRVAVICEIVGMDKDIVPDVSLGTHFFSELVELDILYLAYFPQKEHNFLNEQFLLETPNKLAELLPDVTIKMEDAIRVIDTEDLPGGRPIFLNAATTEQKAVCFVETQQTGSE